MCDYREVCAKNTMERHWTCLVRLHRQLKELRAQEDKIRYQIAEKARHIRKFYNYDNA